MSGFKACASGKGAAGCADGKGGVGCADPCVRCAYCDEFDDNTPCTYIASFAGISVCGTCFRFGSKMIKIVFVPDLNVDYVCRQIDGTPCQWYYFLPGAVGILVGDYADGCDGATRPASLTLQVQIMFDFSSNSKNIQLLAYGIVEGAALSLLFFTITTGLDSEDTSGCPGTFDYDNEFTVAGGWTCLQTVGLVPFEVAAGFDGTCTLTNGPRLAL